MTSAGKRLRSVSTVVPSCFWDWDLTTNQFWRSEQFHQVFGYQPDRDDSSVDAWHSRIHPDDRDKVIRQLSAVIGQGGEWADDYRFLRGDGTYAHVYDQGFTVAHQGKVVRMTGYLTDQSEPTPQRQPAPPDESWKVGLESAEVGTWVVQLNTGLVHWDQQCQSFLGYAEQEQIASADLARHLHPADREQVERLIRQALQTPSDGRFHSECRILTVGDQALRWLQFRGRVTFDANDQPLHIAGAVMDITAERHRQETLQYVEKHFPTAFNNAAIGIVIADLNGRFIQTNGAFGRITGYTPDELASHSYAQVIHPDDLAGYQTRLTNLQATGSGSLMIPVRCVHKEGHGVWVSLHTTLIYDESGRQKSLFSIVQDISQDITTRDEQQKLLRLVDNSLNFMAIADLDGRVTYINKAGIELVGLDSTEVAAGRTVVADFYTPEQYQWLMEEPIPALLRQGHWSGRVQLRHFKTGEAIPCYANGLRIDDPVTGRPIGRGFMMRDLRSELAAQEMQQKLFALVDNSIELMSILEMDGKNSYINKAGIAMLGFDNAQQVQETPVAQLHAPEHFALVEEEVLPSVMSKGRWSGEMQVRHLKTGEIFPVFNNTIRIDDPATGQPLAVGAVMRDMRPERTTQRALLESESRFRSMIMQAPVAIGLLRGETFIVESANSYMLDLWGKGPEIIGHPTLNALPELKGQGFIKLLNGVYESGAPYYGFDTRAQLYRNGQLEDRYFNFVYAPIREANQQISGIMVVATEVTEQVQAKKESEESEKRFRNLVLDAPMATAVYAGPDMVIQLANEAMLNVWGKDSSVIGKKLIEALPELDGQPFHRLLDEVYTSGIAYQAPEDRADLVVDGRLQTFYFNFTYKPLRDATGAVYAILNMAVDVTNQVKARQQLQEAEEGLREAVNLAELAPWTSDVLTGAMVSSERVNEWLGVREPITSEVINQCIHPKDRHQLESAVQRAMTDPTAGGRLDLEYTVINQETGQELILRTHARVLFNEQGAPYLIRGTSQDITAQRITEQALEKQVQLRTEQLNQSNLHLKQSNQELERYAYVASHDLQEPLRKIQMYVDLLREQHLDAISSEGQTYLTKLEKSASRMTMLIRNILDFSRINYETGFVDQVDLNAIVEEVVKDFDLLLNQKNGQVVVNGLCIISAIPLQMTQLFYNLIGNALKFSRVGVPPRITIACRRLSNQELKQYAKLSSHISYCEVTVSDNGIGFKSEFGEKIFGLFQRLHHQQQYEGTGIGLSLCQRIVFNHQGEIWAEAAEGEGATFHVILPIAIDRPG